MLQKLEISPILIGEGILKVEELKPGQCDPFHQGRLDRIAFPATGKFLHLLPLFRFSIRDQVDPTD